LEVGPLRRWHEKKKKKVAPSLNMAMKALLYWKPVAALFTHHASNNHICALMRTNLAFEQHDS
jgi:hypothetical protein